MAEYRKPFDRSKSRGFRSRDTLGPGGKSSRASRYQIPAGTKIDYKNFPLLQKYLTDRGKIVSRRISGISAKQQREMAAAIKQARFLGLLHVGIRRRL